MSSTPTRVWFNQSFSVVRTALGLIRKADTEGRYVLLSSHASEQGSAALEADHFYAEPVTQDPMAYLAWCLDFVQRHQVAIFVPGKEAQLIEEHRHLFESHGTRVLSAATSRTLGLLNDKATFYATVTCPVAPPAPWRAFDDLNGFDQAWEALIENAKQGLCMKPAQSVYGIGFARICENQSVYQLFASGQAHTMTRNSVRQMLGEQPKVAPMLLMDYLPGCEYSVDCVADHGALRCAVARRKPVSGGRAQTIDTSAVIQEACAQIVRQFRLNGVVNIQFRKGAHGLHVLEVNARMSGGLGMACLAGPNLPYLALRGFDLGHAALEPCSVQGGLMVSLVSSAVVMGREPS